jgi:hypothetical protein
MSETKARLYRTAKATISCALFKAGDYVSVEYSRTHVGQHWFKVSKDGKDHTYYPQSHLTEFCL